MARFEVTAPDGSRFEITAPDTATDAEVQAYVQSQFAAPQAQPAVEAEPTPQLPTEIPVEPIDIQAAEAARKEQAPSASEQLQSLRKQSQRFNQAFIAGQASLPLSILQAQEEFQSQIPVVRDLKRLGIEPTSLRQDLAGSLPAQVADVVSFQPEGLSEVGVMVGGGLLAFEEPILNATKKAVDKAQDFARRGITELENLEQTRNVKQVGKLPIEVNGRPVEQVIDDKIASLKKLVSKQKKSEDRLVLKAAEVEDRFHTRIKGIDDELSQASQVDLSNMDSINAQMSRLDAKRVDLQDRLARVNAEVFDPLSVPATGKGASDETRADVARLAFQKSKETQVKKLEKQLNEVIDLQSNYRTIEMGTADDVKKLNMQALRDKLNRQKDSLELQQRVALNKVSDDWDDLSKTWLKKRKQLAKQIDAKDIEKTADQFAEVDEALKRLQDFKEKLSFTYQTIPEKMTARTWSDTLAVDLAKEQAKKVDELVKLKIIPKEQATPLTDFIFNNTLKLQGYIPKDKWVIPPQLRNAVLNATNSMNSVQRKTGVRTGETAIKATQAIPQMQNYTARQLESIQPAIQNLQKMGYSNPEITRVLQYFETAPDKSIRFTTAGLDVPGTRIPAWDPAAQVPSQEAQQQFTALRQWLNGLAEENNIAFRQRYVPIMAEVVDEGGTVKTGVRSISTPAFEQLRQVGELVPGVTETDIEKIAIRYTKNIARSKFAKPVLKDAYDQTTMLRLMGENAAAKALEDYVVDVFNLKNVDDFQRAFVANTFEGALPYINRALKASDLNEAQQVTALNQFLDALQESAAVNLAGVNPRVWMLQALQPEATLAPLVNFRRVEQARLAVAKLPLEEQSRMNRLLKASLADDLEVLEGFSGTKIEASIPKLITTVNKPAKALASKVMGGMEQYNRKVGVKAADILFDEAWNAGQTAGLEKMAFKHLNESQRNFVRTAFQQGGKDSARDAFAVLITNQANFIYNLADKPKILRNDILRRMLFTTFSRGVFNQMATSFEEGRMASLASQIVRPLMLSAVIAGGTGAFLGKSVIIPGLNPTDSVTGLFSTEVRPGPLLPFTTLGALPGVGLYKQVERLPKRRFVQEVNDIPDFLFKNFEETQRFFSGKKGYK
jgi:hypothetical protein